VWRLVWALNTLKDPSGRILIDGFYDDVRPPTSEEREMFEKVKARMNFEEEKKALGIKKWKRDLSGEDLFEDYMMGPIFNIDGINGGYTGPWIKTNLPRSAYAKFSIRMAPNMTPEDILLKLKKHLYLHGFPEIEINVQNKHYHLYRTPPSTDIVKAVVKAYRKHRIEVDLWPTGNGCGAAGNLARLVGLSNRTIFYGLGHGSRSHQVNEYITVEGLKLCEKSWATFLYEYAGM
jgi:acetylornithine deacetylase/succinyl-diaminopimelate desuccinylase-like protein